LQTLVWFAVTLVLALFIPDIGRVISLIGGLAACFIFVFPGTTSVSDSVCVCVYNVFISAISIMPVYNVCSSLQVCV
jgi:hypothetical protein